MKALPGIVLALAAVAGGRLIAASLDHAVNAPQQRFDVEANARIEQFRRESAVRIAAEQAEDDLRLAPLRVALGAQLTMADFDRLQIGMPAAFAHAALAPFQGNKLAQINGVTSYLYDDGSGHFIVALFNADQLIGKSQSGL
jgi:hypothetical protein